MRRRRFLGLIATAPVSWPIAAWAQRQIAPTVGFLYSASAGDRREAFRHGLAEAGFIEDKNVAVEYRFAEGRYERLPVMAAELVRLRVSVLAASGITATVQPGTRPRRFQLCLIPGATP